jgi:hypothetical protein
MEPFAQVGGVLVEPPFRPRVGLEDAEDLEEPGDDRGRDARREDVGAGEMADVVGESARAGEVAADGGGGLREGADRGVDLALEAEDLRRAAPRRADRAEGVRLVDEEPRPAVEAIQRSVERARSPSMLKTRR